MSRRSGRARSLRSRRRALDWLSERREFLQTFKSARFGAGGCARLFRLMRLVVAVPKAGNSVIGVPGLIYFGLRIEAAQIILKHPRDMAVTEQGIGAAGVAIGGALVLIEFRIDVHQPRTRRGNLGDNVGD